MIKFKLIEEWQNFWKLWSLRFTSMGTALLGYIIASPDAITNAWQSLPDDVKQYIPQNYLMYITIGLFVLGMFSRVVKQERLSKPKEDNGTN